MLEHKENVHICCASMYATSILEHVYVKSHTQTTLVKQTRVERRKHWVRFVLKILEPNVETQIMEKETKGS